MAEYKLALAHCSKYNKRFCLELKKIGSSFEVINFIRVTEEEAKKIHSNYFSNDLKTASNLLPCYKCGGRKVGSCACATKHPECNAKDEYNFQCVYCDKLVIEKDSRAGQKIYVASPRYDDIGEVLTSLNVKYSPFKGEFDCDLLFINCGTGDYIDCKKLQAYVSNGGCVYLSDLASSFLIQAFPDVIDVSNDGTVCHVDANVVDLELKQIAGEKINVFFDLPYWSIITNYKGMEKYNGKILMVANGGKYKGKPLMISFKYGKGEVFYTSFHNHAQASEKEKMLLQLLLLKQMGSTANVSLEEMGDLVGLNLSAMKERFKK